MTNRRMRTAILGIMLALAALTLYACAGGTQEVKMHPVPIETAPNCSDCHTDERVALDHSSGFQIRKHKFFAAQRDKVCSQCHMTSFCADCHANREEIKPSDKYKDKPARTLPHRGDYMTQHRVDGRVNPAACFRCHGRQNNDMCKRCHK